MPATERVTAILSASISRSNVELWSVGCVTEHFESKKFVCLDAAAQASLQIFTIQFRRSFFAGEIGSWQCVPIKGKEGVERGETM